MYIGLQRKQIGVGGSWSWSRVCGFGSGFPFEMAKVRFLGVAVGQNYVTCRGAARHLVAIGSGS